MVNFRNFVSLFIVITVAFGVGFMAGQQPDQPTVSAQTDSSEEFIGPLIEAYELLNSRYIDPLETDVLLEGALDGLTSATEDDNTNYMNAEEYARWTESLSGGFEGIGATVEKDEETGGMRIVQPLSGSPAEAAGLLPGDIIIEVGGENITEASLDDIISDVRGPAGTPVRLSIQRDGEEELIEFTIIRDRIEFPDVEYRLLDNNIGYIRLYQFSGETTQRLREALTEIDAENLNGLVLDVRGNPGGFLQTSLDVLSEFVTEGPILIEQLPGGAEQIFEASGNPLAPTVPLAVLVDAGSASASELVAGSLQDLERAVVIGTPTFGKGTVQNIIPISNGGAVRVTVARWVTPDGTSSEPDGIEPDVIVEYDPDSDPDLDNQLEAAIRALKGISREQIYAPMMGAS